MIQGAATKDLQVKQVVEDVKSGRETSGQAHREYKFLTENYMIK